MLAVLASLTRSVTPFLAMHKYTSGRSPVCAAHTPSATEQASISSIAVHVHLHLAPLPVHCGDQGALQPSAAS